MFANDQSLAEFAAEAMKCVIAFEKSAVAEEHI
jgi:hypothetical protein